MKMSLQHETKSATRNIYVCNNKTIIFITCSSNFNEHSKISCKPTIACKLRG